MKTTRFVLAFQRKEKTWLVKEKSGTIGIEALEEVAWGQVASDQGCVMILARQAIKFSFLQLRKKERKEHGERTEHARQPDGTQDSTISPSVSGTGSLRETTRLQGR